MTTTSDGAGWRDLVATFTEADLPIPPAPADLMPRLERRDAWFWSTRDLDRGALYDPGLIIDEATPPADYLAIGHVGHGMNSWFLTYQLVSGPLALFAQIGWGGAFEDGPSDRETLRDQYAAIQTLLDLTAGSAGAWADDLRLIVLAGEDKGIDVCTWVALDDRPRPELLTWPRRYGSASALQRAATELGGHRRSSKPTARTSTS
jgi:hypothetical protein